MDPPCLKELVRNELASDQQQTRPEDGERGDAYAPTPSRLREKGQQQEPEQREQGGRRIVPDANCIEAYYEHDEQRRDLPRSSSTRQRNASEAECQADSQPHILPKDADKVEDGRTAGGQEQQPHGTGQVGAPECKREQYKGGREQTKVEPVQGYCGAADA